MTEQVATEKEKQIGIIIYITTEQQDARRSETRTIALD